MTIRTAEIGVPRHAEHQDFCDRIAKYLPDNYNVGEFVTDEYGYEFLRISGEDVAGWTLDDYVLPRLASGLHFGREVDASPSET